MLSRPISVFEKWFINSKLTLQSAAELVNPRVATEFVDYIIRTNPGYHLRTDGTNYIVEPSPPDVATIPASLKTAIDTSLWAETGLNPDFSKRLATIAVNGCHVVWNESHSVYDGVSLMHLVDRFQRGVPPTMKPFPAAVDERLRDTLSRITDAHRHVTAIANCSRVPWSHPIVKFHDSVRCDCHIAQLPWQALQCFDARKDKFIGLTDALWRSAMLVAHAIDPSQSNFACCTWVNLRPYLNDTDIGNTISPLVVAAPGATKEMTVGQFEERIRRDFAAKLKRNDQLLGLKSYVDDLDIALKPASFYDVSNSGYFPNAGPFVDMFLMQSALTSMSLWAIAFGSATLYGGPNRKILFRYPYSQAVYTRKDTERYMKALMHSLQFITAKMTVKDAIAQLRTVLDSK
jgi:hypothetical protein